MEIHQFSNTQIIVSKFVYYLVCQEVYNIQQNLLYYSYIYIHTYEHKEAKHMNRGHNQSIAERYLSKNKKYYSYTTIKKDKENIVNGDINSIIQKLSNQKRLPKIGALTKKNRSPITVIQTFTNRRSQQKGKLNVNSIHFFQQDQHELMIKKQLKKQLIFYINKIKQPVRTKCSLYQQYLSLSQETNDYLEYYLTNFTGEDPGRATQLLKQQGKTIILLILRKKYKCFETNPSDISNRIFLSFHLNPLNDFQFISWEKFMRIRKLISGDFNRKDYTDFILDYFFIQSKKTITGGELWLIFSSVLRKLSATLDASNLEILLSKIKRNLEELIPQQEILSFQKLHKIILQDPMFIWHQFVTLAFV